MKPPKPNCLLCAHFYHTYKLPLAYGCHAYGFVSRQYPNLAVHAATGMLCLQYRPATDPAPTGPAPGPKKPGWLA